MTAWISVAVTTRARARLLDECLLSIVNQTVIPFEIIVSEDGEDSETAAVVQRHAAVGAPIRHVRNVPPLGQLGNRQRALQLTTGDFVAMLDDDDTWNETFLSETLAAIEASHCGFCSTDHYIMNDASKVSEEDSRAASNRFGRSTMVEGKYEDVLYRELVWKPFPLGCTLFARTALESIGFFPTYGGVVADFALFLELGVNRISGFYLPKRLGRYRAHHGQQTRNRIEMGEDLTTCLRLFYGRHRFEISERERDELGRLFRQSVLELAIAYAHARERLPALAVLRSFGSLGWGWPPPQRVAVLGALLAGASKRPRPGST
jgi:glycosyltransferase involved in cell wall biosynthesis